MDISPPRVLVTAFSPVPGSGPDASALLGMSAALHAQMDFVTLKTEALPHVGHFGPVRMFRVPVGLGSPADQREAFARAVRRQLDAEPYQVVHVRGPVEGRVVAERHQELGYRFAYEIGSFPDEAEGPDAERAWNEAHAQCMEQADLVLVPTDATMRFLAEKGFGGKLAVVHPGVDVEAYDWWPARADKTVRIVYLGTFEADRDLGTVLGAVREVAKTTSVQLLLAGDANTERRERVRRVADAFGLGSIAHVRGEPRATAIPAVIGAADVCLAPASAAPRFQDFGDLPQPLLEYLACRRPVVAAGVPGVPEVLRDEKEGLIYSPGDETSLAEAIRTLIDQQTLRTRLAESAYDRVRWLFSGGARRRRIAEVYEMLLPGSQTYHAWDDAFESEITGSHSMPSRMQQLDYSADLYTATDAVVRPSGSELASTTTAVDVSDEPPPRPSSG